MLIFIWIMNVGSLSLQKITIMKASVLIKVFFVLPLLLFADYILMAILGCTTCLFGLGEEFYCGSFCLAGKIILALSAIFFGYLIFPDIKAIFKLKKHGASA
jgi:hypothetical protein